MSVRILIGDMRKRLRDLPDASVDSCVCDPPYHLTSIVKRFGGENAKEVRAGVYNRSTKGFMGQSWDGGDVAFQPETWAEVLRVLKPGAHLVAFSGTRTYHRMVCAIEDAGFEIRDQLAWCYGSGFPKSHNQPGGWGTALKPAWEPICLARKPLIGTVAANVLEHGTGALNIDGCRVGFASEADKETAKPAGKTLKHTGWNQSSELINTKPVHDLGRWPANIIHDGSEEVLAGFPETESGVMRAGTRRAAQDGPGSVCYGTYGGNATNGDTFGDSGSAARFFYCAKATTGERGEGNNHPTVKPVDLMRWLCRLVTPKGGTVLDPFMGSGSTMIAADAEQFNGIGCELSPEYAAIAEKRIRQSAGLFADVVSS
jgi:site-specific DNA-methyltransferase (adenine-specific)